LGHKHKHCCAVLTPELFRAAGYLCHEPTEPDKPFVLNGNTKVYRKRDEKWLQRRVAYWQKKHDNSEGFVELKKTEQKCQQYRRALETANLDLGRHITPIYVLPLLIGHAAGLTPLQCHLLSSIGNELTRKPRTKRRTHHKEPLVYTGGDETGCRLLPQEGSYVGFNGQGCFGRKSCRGAGYLLITRMKRAGYVKEPDEHRFWARVRLFLQDLEHLETEFGLAVAFRDDLKRWHSLDEARALLANPKGRQQFLGVRLHIYDQPDFVERWRTKLCEKANIVPIDESRQHNRIKEESKPRRQAAPKAPEPNHPDNVWLRGWLEDRGLSLREAAKALGVSSRYVIYLKTGQRPLPEALKAKMQSIEVGGEQTKKAPQGVVNNTGFDT
jgi:hypothetical protein